MTSITRFALLSILSLTGLFLTACPEQKRIADIQREPGRYQDKEVVVVGRVVDSYGISVPGTNIGGGAYKIDDGTGSIWVIASEGSVPSRGAEVGVKGRVNSGLNWKGKNYGLGIYEESRRYRKR